MRPIAAITLVVLGGCTFAEPQTPPYAHDEVAGMLKFSADHDAVLAIVRERGIAPMGADCIVELKKCGATDELIQKLVALERDTFTPAEAHARLHRQGGRNSAICGECGAWIRVP